MMGRQNKEIPVYVFMGFLESGKTTFAKETLMDRGFTGGAKTLLLVSSPQTISLTFRTNTIRNRS